MQRIFAADIGGTNARFALFTEHEGSLVLTVAVWVKSADLRTAEDLLQIMQRQLQCPLAEGDMLVIALAGPTHGLRGKLTNGQLQVDLGGVAQQYGLSCCLLINDFTAQAFATLTPAGAGATVVRGRALPDTESLQTKAVFGAGTGLGAASLVCCGGEPGIRRWFAVPSEAGHTPFAFMGAEEHAYQDFLARELGCDMPSAENVLCGEGLSILHYYLSGQFYSPPSVGDQALSCDTPTLHWYARFLGRFCRQWILTSLSRGGLWIAGGIAAKNPGCVEHPAFLQAFAAGNDVGGIVSATPILLITNVDSGLWGAARAALEHQRGQALAALAGG